MRIVKNTISALVAVTLTAGITASVIPYTELPENLIISADTSTDIAYSFSFSEEKYKPTGLKTLKEYFDAGLVYSTNQIEEIENGSLDNRYVAEVKVTINKNSGFYLDLLGLDYDPDLVFAGCKYYQDGSKKQVSKIKDLPDANVSADCFNKKVLITMNGSNNGLNIKETGEIFTLLFVLPENPVKDKAYKATMSLANSRMTLPEGSTVFNCEHNGSITISDSASDPEPASYTKLNFDVSAQNSVISDETKQVKINISVSEADIQEVDFDYAGIGVDLPAGYTLEEIKPALDFTSSMKGLTLPDNIAKYANTEFKSNTGYYICTGADIKSLNHKADIFTVTLNVPDNAKVIDDIAFSVFFGKYKTDTVTGKKTTDGVLYREKNAKIIKGKKGDFDLDGKVSATDATYLLRYNLEADINKTANRSDILYGLLNGQICKEYAGESKEDLYYIAASLGDVDESDGGHKTNMTDATYILRAVLEASATSTEIKNSLWDKFF